jgi:hypothetical protein
MDEKITNTGIADIPVRIITNFQSIADKDVRDPGGFLIKINSYVFGRNI